MKQVALLISGGGSNMLRLIEDMQGDHPARPCLVISNEPDAAGLTRAAQCGVQTAVVNHRGYDSRETFEEALRAMLDLACPDIICLAGFMRILTPVFVSAYAGRMLNIHPSLLPKYKGLNTHQRALAAGESEAGCTVHEVTATLDDGPILGQARVPVLPEDTEKTLATRVLRAEHMLYPQVLRRFAQDDREPLWLSA